MLDNITPENATKAIESLQNELIEKDATILALQSELQRMQNELQNSTRVVRREHPLQVRLNACSRQFQTVALAVKDFEIFADRLCDVCVCV